MAFSKLERWRIKLRDTVPSALERLVPPPRHKKIEASLAAGLLSQHIHPPAEMLLPFLKSAFEGTNAHQLELTLVSMSGASGDLKLAWPYVLKALESTNQKVQLLATVAISDFKWEKLDSLDITTAASNLTGVANSPSYRNAVFALQVLGDLGTNASSAVPALQELLANETNGRRREDIANTLKKIQPPAAP